MLAVTGVFSRNSENFSGSKYLALRRRHAAKQPWKTTSGWTQVLLSLFFSPPFSPSSPD
jgi:hypothetical protein